MKTLKGIIVLCVESLFLAALLITFPGCTKHSPLGPELGDNHDIAIISKPTKKTVVEPVPDEPIIGELSLEEPVISHEGYPQFGEATLRYDRKHGAYAGAMIKTPNNSNFWIYNWSVTPPPDVPMGNPLTITMQIDMSPAGNELLFTFGPSGCKFDPEAQVIMDYSDLLMGDLGDEVPSLFIIDENGDYIPEDPQNYKVDVLNKWIYLYIPHFSRYSLIRR